MLCVKCGTHLIFIRSLSPKVDLWKCGEKRCGALHLIEPKPVPCEPLCSSSGKQKRKTKKQKRRERNERRRQVPKMSDMQDTDL